MALRSSTTVVQGCKKDEISVGGKSFFLIQSSLVNIHCVSCYHCASLCSIQFIRIFHAARAKKSVCAMGKRLYMRGKGEKESRAPVHFYSA